MMRLPWTKRDPLKRLLVDGPEMVAAGVATMPPLAVPKPIQPLMAFGTKAELTYRYALVEILRGEAAPSVALRQIAQKALNKHGGRQYKEPASD